jgi:hypothetical protein
MKNSVTKQDTTQSQNTDQEFNQSQISTANDLSREEISDSNNAAETPNNVINNTINETDDSRVFDKIFNNPLDYQTSPSIAISKYDLPPEIAQGYIIETPYSSDICTLSSESVEPAGCCMCS